MDNVMIMLIRSTTTGQLSWPLNHTKQMLVQDTISLHGLECVACDFGSALDLRPFPYKGGMNPLKSSSRMQPQRIPPSGLATTLVWPLGLVSVLGAADSMVM
jgi:hypothetical protein